MKNIETIEEGLKKERLKQVYWIDEKGFRLGAKWQKKQDEKVIEDLKNRLDIVNQIATRCIKLINNIKKNGKET